MAEELAADITAIKKMVEDRVANDVVKERAFDQLYSELKQYKNDWLFQNEKPLLLDLLLFYDTLQWFAETLRSGETQGEALADSFQYIVDELLEVLYRRDVAPIPSPSSFDAKLQKAVKVETTDVAADDGRIVAVLKRGFSRGDRLLRPEEVVLARTRKS